MDNNENPMMWGRELLRKLSLFHYLSGITIIIIIIAIYFIVKKKESMYQTFGVSELKQQIHNKPTFFDSEHENISISRMMPSYLHIGR